MSSRLITYVSEEHNWLEKCCINCIEVLTGRNALEKVYAKVKAEHRDPKEIWGAALKALKIDLTFDERKLAQIPKSGPLVIIANHPFGVADGLALASLTLKTRSHFLFPVNSVLFRDEVLNEFLLPIDFSPTKNAIRTNIKTKQIILDHLQQNGTLVIFPSGGVATAKTIWGPAVDLEWKRFVAKVASQSDATVVPIYFHGQNSRIFHWVSRVSQTLRLSLLLHELCNKRGKALRVAIGDPILPSELKKFKGRQEMTDFLKKKTFDLQHTFDEELKFATRFR